MKLIHWYEFRVDGEKVAAVGPISRKASTKVYKILEGSRKNLYKDKVLQIVACYDDSRTERIIHEEHPTVLEFEVPQGCLTPLPKSITI